MSSKYTAEPSRLEDKRTLPIFIHSAIDERTDVPPNAMRVYMHLVRRADKSGVAWPSYQSIGDHCFVSISDNAVTRKSYARKAIDQLIASGLIRKEERLRDDGSQTSNVYVLNDPCLISTPMPIGTPMPIKHPDANLAGAMPIKQGPCLSGTLEDIPNEDSPLKEEDGSSSFWAHELAQLEPTLPVVAAKRLAGSQLETDDLTHFRVVLRPDVTDGLDWLNRQAHGAIVRALSVRFGRRVEVEIVMQERIVTNGEETAQIRSGL